MFMEPDLVKPSRVFAAEATRPAVPVPEPLSRRARGKLSDAARRERLREELRYVESLYVPNPTQQQCTQTILEMLECAEWSLPGARDSLYVLGRPGTGKSSAVRAAALQFHRDQLAMVGFASDDNDPVVQADGYRCDFVPAVMVTVRAAARNRAYVSQIADFLGYPAGANTAATLTDQIFGMAKRHFTKLLIADDVRNLADLGRDRDAIHNLIKNLNTDLGYVNVTHVYVGNPDEAGFGNLYRNEQLAQRLIPFGFADMGFDMDAVEEPPQNIEWFSYLMKWEGALRPVLPDLEEQELASILGRRLWKRTEGSVGGLAGLLKRATQNQLRSTGRLPRLTLTKSVVGATAMPGRFSQG